MLGLVSYLETVGYTNIPSQMKLNKIQHTDQTAVEQELLQECKDGLTTIINGLYRLNKLQGEITELIQWCTKASTKTRQLCERHLTCMVQNMSASLMSIQNDPMWGATLDPVMEGHT